MAKQTRLGRDSGSEKFIGVSTSSDVKAFKKASGSLAARVVSSKSSARDFVTVIEKRTGLVKDKKK